MKKTPIVLVSHRDTVWQKPIMKKVGGYYVGHLDNLLGCHVAREVAHRTGIPHHLTDFEEVYQWIKGRLYVSSDKIDQSRFEFKGARELAGRLPKDAIILVVDVAETEGKYDISFENSYGLSTHHVRRLLRGCPVRFRYIPKYIDWKAPEISDETDAFGAAGLKTMGCIIPVKSFDAAKYHAIGSWHGPRGSRVAVNTVEKFKQGLMYVINRFGEYEN